MALPGSCTKGEQYGNKRGAKQVEDYCIINQMFSFVQIAEKEDSRKHPGRDCAGGQERERVTRQAEQ